MSHLLKATEDGPASEPWSALTSYLTNITGTSFVALFELQRSRLDVGSYQNECFDKCYME